MALRLIRERASTHRRELQANWKKMKAGHPLSRIEPLQRGVAMTFLPPVIRAEHRGGYRIHVTFNDNAAPTLLQKRSMSIRGWGSGLASACSRRRQSGELWGPPRLALTFAAEVDSCQASTLRSGRVERNPRSDHIAVAK